MTPLSMGFSRQEYWSGLPCLPTRDLPQGSNLHFFPRDRTVSLAGGLFTTSATSSDVQQQEITKPLSGNNIKLPKPTRVFT